MNNDAGAKIKMLKGSVRCFAFGLLGRPFALTALWISGRVRAKEKLFWNAARPYRIWGVVCAAVGVVFWTAILAIVVARALMIAQGLG